MPPFHLARAMVHSFPYFLDTREMVLQLLQLNNATPNQKGMGKDLRRDDTI